MGDQVTKVSELPDPDELNAQVQKRNEDIKRNQEKIAEIGMRLVAQEKELKELIERFDLTGNETIEREVKILEKQMADGRAEQIILSKQTEVDEKLNAEQQELQVVQKRDVNKRTQVASDVSTNQAEVSHKLKQTPVGWKGEPTRPGTDGIINTLRKPENMKQVESRADEKGYLQSVIGSKEESSWLFSSKDGKESFEVMKDKATTSSFSKTNSELLASIYILGIKGQNIASIKIDGATPEKIAMLEEVFAKELKKNGMDGIFINDKKVEEILKKPVHESSPATLVAAAAANDEEPSTPRPH